MSEMLMDCSTMTDHTPAKQATILLVEDKERVLRVLHAFLQRRGYDVIGVRTVEEAEQLLDALGPAGEREGPPGEPPPAGRARSLAQGLCAFR